MTPTVLFFANCNVTNLYIYNINYQYYIKSEFGNFVEFKNKIL